MIQLKVNGVPQSFDGDPEMPLLWYLRDILGLTGTKFGCGIALCGACTVHKNGEALRACITPTSALCASSAMSFAGTAPLGTRASALVLSRSNTVSSYAWSSRRWAIRLPMLPRPINPSFTCRAARSFISSPCGLLNHIDEILGQMSPALGADCALLVDD